MLTPALVSHHRREGKKKVSWDIKFDGQSMKRVPRPTASWIVVIPLSEGHYHCPIPKGVDGMRRLMRREGNSKPEGAQDRRTMYASNHGNVGFLAFKGVIITIEFKANNLDTNQTPSVNNFGFLETMLLPLECGPFQLEQKVKLINSVSGVTASFQDRFRSRDRIGKGGRGGIM
ncbi:hypothetical protein J6590_011987 [Homalodisca vitripennis]|nr:hypothetical protein J6590_011987 [Homalodisca vitripennis]